MPVKDIKKSLQVIDEYNTTDIETILNTINIERKKLVFKCLMYLLIAIAIAIALTAIKWNEHLNIVLIIIAVILALFFLGLSFKVSSSYNEIKFNLSKKLLENINLNCVEADVSIFDKDVLTEYIGDFDYINYYNSHIIKNEFVLMQYLQAIKEEEKTYTDSDGSTRTETKEITVFKGYFMFFDLSKDYQSYIYITSSVFHLSDILPILHDKTRVKLDNPDFERVYDVYSNDQINARYYLDNKRMEKFVQTNMIQNDLIIDEDIGIYSLKIKPLLINIPFYRNVKYKYIQRYIDEISNFNDTINNIYNLIK